MAEYLFGSFGDSVESAGQNYKAWASGFEKWYKTEPGKIIQHIFLGVKLALQSQGRVVVLQSQGIYLGFALLGCRMSIAIRGEVIHGESSEVVRLLAVALDNHSMALDKICKRLSELTVTATAKKEEIKPTDVKNTRHLVKLVQDRTELDGDEWDAFEKEWEMITFTERFWPLTHGCIAKAVSTIFSSDEVDEGWPLYVPAKLIYNTGRPTSVLGVFGPMAPSFLDQRGIDIPIPEPGAEDKADIVDQATGKRMMEVVLVSGKKLENAVDDFDNVVKKRRIRQNPGERAAGFRTIKFQGKARDEIWAALKKMPSKNKGNEKKRGRDEDDEDGEEGQSKKKGKTVDTSIAFSLDDF